MRKTTTTELFTWIKRSVLRQAHLPEDSVKFVAFWVSWAPQSRAARCLWAHVGVRHHHVDELSECPGRVILQFFKRLGPSWPGTGYLQEEKFADRGSYSPSTNRWGGFPYARSRPTATRRDGWGRRRGCLLGRWAHPDALRGGRPSEGGSKSESQSFFVR